MCAQNPTCSDPALAEDRPGRERYERTAAEPGEGLACGRVRGHHAGLLELPPAPVHRTPDQLTPFAANPPLEPLPPRHHGIVPRAALPRSPAPVPAGCGGGRVGRGAA
jgi:hypothetical protein